MNKIFDLHNDYLTTLKKEKDSLRYLKSKKLVCIENIISAVWTSNLSMEDSIKKIEACSSFIDNFKNSNININLAIEDLHFISKNNLAKVINMRPIYCSLTWNNDNLLAGGAMEGGDLTSLGIQTIKELEDNKIIVDTAHLSERSFMSFSNITEKPLLCSHTAVASLVSNRRNLKDYQIKMIVESGGLIGIALVGSFLSNDKYSTISDIVRHIDYIVSRFGCQNIALGTDFFGTKNLPKNIKNYNNLILVEERLRAIGYSDQMINNIFYDNAKRFFKENVYNI